MDQEKTAKLLSALFEQVGALQRKQDQEDHVATLTGVPVSGAVLSWLESKSDNPTLYLAGLLNVMAELDVLNITTLQKRPLGSESFEAFTLEELAAVFAKMREHTQASQDSVANSCKISQKTVGRIEGQNSNPTYRTMSEVSSAYGYRMKIVFEPQN